MWARKSKIDNSTPNQRRFLLIGIFAFLLFKIIWIVVPPTLTHTPRLGDDALVYLWWGASSVFEPRVDSPAIKDIAAIRHLNDGGSDELDWLRARATMRSVKVSANPAWILSSLLLKTGISQTAVFTATEVIIALFLTAGLTAFLTAVVGIPSAAWALLFLTFAILPLQGLHYLIASVLCLSLGLLLWAELTRPLPRILVVIIISAATLMVHQIGLVYVCIAAAYIVLVQYKTIASISFESFLARFPFKYFCSIVFTILFVNLLKFTLGEKAPPTNGIGEITFSTIFPNLLAALQLVGENILTMPLVWSLGIIGFLYAIKEGESKTIAFLFLLVCVFFLGTTFNISGYPPEVSARIFVCILIVLAGLAGAALNKLLVGPIWSRLAVLSLIAVSVYFQALNSYNAFYANINGRPFMYDEEKIATDMASLSNTSSIIWADSENSMMAAFLKGAWKFRALPYSMIDGSPQLDEIFSAWKPTEVAAALPNELNMLSAIQNRSLSKRFYGLGFDRFEKAIVVIKDLGLSEVYLKLSRLPSAGNFKLTLSAPNKNCSQPDFTLLNYLTETWLKVDVSNCKSADSLEFSTEDTVALLGLQTQTPMPRLNWPWGSNIKLIAIPRNRGLNNVSVDFSFDHLFGNSLYRKMRSNYLIKVRSDESGIVWSTLGAPPLQ